jgi:GNAT superfamily N-acetyltransferase
MQAGRPHAAAMGEIILRDLKIGDAGWLIGQHGELYAREEGFDRSFEALVAEILADFIRNHDPSCERGWIAEEDGQRLGSIFCVRLDQTTAKLRLFLLLPAARGKGLGKRLLQSCMDHARDKGFTRMQLWTHESHRAACALYAAAGWRCTASKPVRSFGVDLVEQTWEVDL